MVCSYITELQTTERTTVLPELDTEGGNDPSQKVPSLAIQALDCHKSHTLSMPLSAVLTGIKLGVVI